MPDPHSPRPVAGRRLGRLGILLAAFATLSGSSLVGTVLSARLVNHHPLLLLALAPANRHLLLTSAAGVSPAGYAVVAGLRYAVGGTVLYLLGRDYGDSCRAWLARQPGGVPGSIRWLETAFDRAWWVVLPVMVGSNGARLLGGAAKIPARTYAAVLGVGIAGRLALFWYLGRRFRPQLERVLDVIERYQWWIVAAFFVVTFAQSWRRALAAERGGAGIPAAIETAGVEPAAEAEPS